MTPQPGWAFERDMEWEDALRTIYQRTLQVQHAGSAALTNYQAEVIVDTATPIAAGHMRADGKDVWVLSADKVTLLHYYIEPDTLNTTNTRVWIKMPLLPANSMTNVLLRYGLPQGNTAMARGEDTFDYFEDFDWTNGVYGNSGWHWLDPCICGVFSYSTTERSGWFRLKSRGYSEHSDTLTPALCRGVSAGSDFIAEIRVDASSVTGEMMERWPYFFGPVKPDTANGCYAFPCTNGPADWHTPTMLVGGRNDIAVSFTNSLWTNSPIHHWRFRHEPYVATNGYSMTRTYCAFSADRNTWTDMGATSFLAFTYWGLGAGPMEIYDLDSTVDWDYYRERQYAPVPPMVTAGTEAEVGVDPLVGGEISGRITDVNTGEGLDGIRIMLSSWGELTTTNGGYYSARLYGDMTVTVTPVCGDRVFAPVSRTYTTIFGDQPNQDYSINMTQSVSRTTNCLFRRTILVQNTNSVDLTDYQVLIPFDMENSRVCPDGRDVRFPWRTDDTPCYSVELLNYWINPDALGRTNTELWVKVPLLRANQTAELTMEYGDLEATPMADGEATFVFFDDFEGSSIDSQKWNIVNGMGWSISGGRLRGTNTSGYLASKAGWLDSFMDTVEVKTALRTPAPHGHVVCGYLGYLNIFHGYIWMAPSFTRSTTGWWALWEQQFPEQKNWALDYMRHNQGLGLAGTNLTAGREYLLSLSPIDAVWLNGMTPVIGYKAYQYDDGRLVNEGNYQVGPGMALALGGRCNEFIGPFSDLDFAQPPFTNEVYDADWDWIRVRKTCRVGAPIVTVGGETAKEDARSIVGRITYGATGVGGLYVDFTNWFVVRTDASGWYTNHVKNGWSGTVTPRAYACGYYSPASRAYTHVTVAQTDQHFTLLGVSPPGAFTLETPTNGQEMADQATLMWAPSSCAREYDVYLGTNETPPWVATVTACVWSFAITNSGDFQWYVIARNVAGSRRSPESGTGAFCAYKTFAFTGQKTIAATDYAYEGMELIQDGGTLTIEGSHRFAHLTLLNGAVLTHPATTTSRIYRLDLTVDRRLTIDGNSMIDVSGRGYPRGYTHPHTMAGASQGNAGGSYGGLGGASGGTPNERYGDYRNPSEPGSGSGMGAMYGNHAGGGLVRIKANEVSLDGAIRANGIDGKYARGSGGGIYLDVGALSGNGGMEANGGNGTMGGGGGGRIALYYEDLVNFIPTNQITVSGGTADFATKNGGVGTLYVKKQGEDGHLIAGDITGLTSFNRVNSHQTSESRTSYRYDPAGRITQMVFEVFGVFAVTNQYSWAVDGQLSSWTDGQGRRYTLNYGESGRLMDLEIPGLGSMAWQDYTWDRTLMPRPALAQRDLSWMDWEEEGADQSDISAMLPRWDRPSSWRGWDWAGSLRAGLWRQMAPLAGYDELALNTEPVASGSFGAEVGAALGFTLPGGATVTYGYDAWGRIDAVVARDPGGNTVFSEARQYNAADRVIARSVGGREQGFVYDTHGRLLSATGLPTGNEAFTYDARGNRLSTAWATNAWSYDVDNQLRSYGSATAEYDAAGRLILTASGGQTNRYVYDQAGRLIQALDGEGQERVAYGYDARDARLWKRVNGQKTWFVRDHGGLIAEYSEAGEEVRSFGRTAAGAPPVFIMEQGVYLWPISDAQGTARRLLRPNGQVVWSADWSAFGEVSIGVSSVSNAFGFAGFEYEPETGLLFDGRRYYEPRTGRYLTPDAKEQRRGESGYALAGQDPFRARPAAPAGQENSYAQPMEAFSALSSGGWMAEPNYQRGREEEAPGVLASWGHGIPDPFANLEQPPVPLCIEGSGGACQDGSGEATEMDREEIGVICAQVTIEIKQQLTLERQAFEAHMKIDNAMPDQKLTDVQVEVTFADAEGNTVVGSSNPNQTNAAFFIRLDRKTQITAVDGTGVVAANTAANIYWLIIPSPGIGGEDPRGRLYYVGAKLTYKIAGDEYVTEVSPDYIFVKPMPELRLDYFLPSLVYGDDAFTPEIEPPVPFPLGVRVQNNGYGYARNLRIESAQPRIVENRQALLIGFQITGSEVNGSAASESLTVNFGDLAPARSAAAHWAMECTLSGEFVAFDACFTHADELGGELTSLLKGVYTHELVREVQVDLPGRDGIRDFLARDDDVLRVYESDNVESEVSDATARTTLSLRGETQWEQTYVLTVPETNCMFLASSPLTDSLLAPFLEVKSATRADGKAIKPANVWISTWRREGGAPWQYDLNLFDVDRGGPYVITLARKVLTGNAAPVLAYVGDKVTAETSHLGFMLRASDPNGDPIAILSTNLPEGAVLNTVSNGLAEFLWDVPSGAWGVYDVTFRATDGQLFDTESIRIYAGHLGDGVSSNGIPQSLVGHGRAPLNPGALYFDCGSTNLLIQWQASPDAVGDVIAYRVYEATSTGLVQLAETPAMTMAYAWNGLTPGTAYMVRVTAYDQEGLESSGLNEIGATWAPHPTDLTALTFSKQVDLSWTPACPTELIQGYHVYYSVEPFTNISQMTPQGMSAATTTVFTVKNLVDGQPYRFAVAAVNRSGCVNPTVATVTATPQPDATGPTLDEARWGSDLITNGMVFARPNAITLVASDRSGVDWALFRINGQNVGTSTAPATLSYAWNVASVANGNYTLNYRLYDRLGNLSSYTNTVKVQLAAPDTRPVFLTPGDRCITNAAWVPVGGQAYASSEVRFSLNGVAITNRAYAGADGAFSVTLPLAAGVNVFRATAVNRGGTGPESDPLIVTLDVRVPLSPTNVVATAREQGEIALSWEAPDEQTILGYHVYRATEPFDDAALAVRINDSLLLDKRLNDLPPVDGLYYYRMTRVALSGAESPLSEPVVEWSDRLPPRVRAIVFTPSGLYDPVSGRYGPGRVDVSVTLSEELQGTPYVAISRTNGLPISITLSRVTETHYQGTFMIEQNTPSGVGYLLFSGRDLAGNRGTEIDGVAQIHIDAEGPEITALALSPSEPIENVAEYPAHIYVTAQFSEEIKRGTTPRLSYRFSGRTNVGVVADMALTGVRTWHGTFDLPPAAGAPPETMSFSLWAEDALGNVGTTISVQNFFQVYQGDLPALTSPLGLVAKGERGGKVRLTWRAVEGAADYQLYRNAPGESELTPLVRSGGLLVFVDEPSIEGIYQYAVSAVREENGQEAVGDPCVPVTVVSDATPPGAPSNVMLELTGRGILVNWSAPPYTEPISFNLYRAGGMTLTSVTGLTARVTEWVETSLVDPTPSQSEHVYTVTAVDEVGNESEPAPSAYLNFRLLPISALEVRLSRGTLPVVSWTHPYPLELAGYDFYLGDGAKAVKLNGALIRSSTYIDTGYTGDERDYAVVAVDKQYEESWPRSINLPMIGATLEEGERLDRGIMNRLTYVVSNRSSHAVSNVQLQVSFGQQTNVSERFHLGAETNMEVDVVMGGLTNLPAVGALTCRLLVRPNPGELVSVADGQVYETGAHWLPFVLRPGVFTRGGAGVVEAVLYNDSEEDIEVITATAYGNRASSDVRVKLMDKDGNVYSVTACQQAEDPGVVALAQGDVVGRIAPGGSFAFRPIEVLIPTNAPDDLEVLMEIDNLYWHRGWPDETKVNGIVVREPVTLTNTPYYATVQSVTPAVSMGDQDVVITGQAFNRLSGRPEPGVTVNLTVSWQGYEMIEALDTDMNGVFTYSFKPLKDISGLYRVWAQHPDMRTKVSQTEFTIVRMVSVYTDCRLRLPVDFDQVIQVKIKAGEGTMGTNLRWEYLAEDQPGGAFSDALDITPGAPTNLLPRAEGAVSFTVRGRLITSGTAILRLVSDETGTNAWLKLPVYYVFAEATPSIYSTPSYVQTGVARNDLVAESLILANRGLAALRGMRLELVTAAGAPAPSWLTLNGPSEQTDLQVGETRQVDVAFLPDDSVDDGHYSFYLRVSGSNMPPAQFALYVAVTSSGKGHALFKVSDMYTGTLNGQGQLIQGLAGARVRIQHATVMSIDRTLSTDGLGEAQFMELPAGIYNFRVSASGCDAQVGAFEIDPGQTTLVETHMNNQLVSVEWEVRPITVEDRYEVVLKTTYATEVPAAVVEMHPASITLPTSMGKAGRSYFGMVLLKNTGLIRADNVQISIPPANEYFVYGLATDEALDFYLGQHSSIPIQEFGAGFERWFRTNGVVLASVEAGQVESLFIRVNCLKDPDEGDMAGGGGPRCNPIAAAYSGKYSYECANGKTGNGNCGVVVTYPVHGGCVTSAGGGPSTHAIYGGGDGPGTGSGGGWASGGWVTGCEGKEHENTNGCPKVCTLSTGEKVCQCRAHSGALTCPRCPGDLCPSCPGDKCPECDDDGDGVKEGCYICDLNFDRTPDACAQFDCDGDGKKESCFKLDLIYPPWEEDRYGVFVGLNPKTKMDAAVPLPVDDLNLAEVRLEFPNRPPSGTVTVHLAPEGIVRAWKDRKKTAPAALTWTLPAAFPQKFYLEGVAAGQVVATVSYSGQTPVCQDVMTVTVARAAIYTDYDQNRTVDEVDFNQASSGRLFRFWLNNDNDKTAVKGYDGPVEGVDDQDGHNDTVDGERDLMDFFPLAVDIKGLLDACDSSLVTVELNPGAFELNYVEPQFTQAEASRYLIQAKSVERLASERVTALVGENRALKQEFLDRIKTGKNVLLLEGIMSSVEGEIRLIIRSKLSGEILFQWNIPTQLSSVEDMFRFQNLLHVCTTDEGYPTRMEEPPNRPDNETDGTSIVFAHGYGVNANTARGGMCEFFKRMYWSGMKSKFYSVHWFSYDSEIFNAVTPDYYVNVTHAFETAEQFKQMLEYIGGDLTVIAHSAGNLLTSAAIHDYDAPVTRYFMLNAAVPKAAYDGNAAEDLEAMRHPDWKDFNPRLFTANWHLLFDGDDNRSRLTWRDRFYKVLPVAQNYHTHDEDVLQRQVGNPRTGPFPFKWETIRDHGRYAWPFQEKTKGLNSFANGQFGSTYGGWGFEYSEAEFPVAYIPSAAQLDYYNKATNLMGLTYYKRKSVEQLNATPDEVLRRNPFFKHDGPGNDMDLNEDTLYSAENGSAYVTPQRHRQMLAEMIPAMTLATALEPVDTLQWEGGGNYDMPTLFKGDWPPVRLNSSFGDDWLHCDFEAVAYVYVYRLYDHFVRNQHLGASRKGKLNIEYQNLPEASKMTVGGTVDAQTPQPVKVSLNIVVTSGVVQVIFPDFLKAWANSNAVDELTSPIIYVLSQTTLPKVFYVTGSESNRSGVINVSYAGPEEVAPDKVRVRTISGFNPYYKLVEKEKPLQLVADGTSTFYRTLGGVRLQLTAVGFPDETCGWEASGGEFYDGFAAQARKYSLQDLTNGVLWTVYWQPPTEADTNLTVTFTVASGGNPTVRTAEFRTRTLRQTERPQGDDVRMLQSILHLLGYEEATSAEWTKRQGRGYTGKVTVDGDFGPRTGWALWRFLGRDRLVEYNPHSKPPGSSPLPRSNNIFLDTERLKQLVDEHWNGNYLPVYDMYAKYPTLSFAATPELAEKYWLESGQLYLGDYLSDTVVTEMSGEADAAYARRNLLKAWILHESAGVMWGHNRKPYRMLTGGADEGDPGPGSIGFCQYWNYYRWDTKEQPLVNLNLYSPIDNVVAFPMHGEAISGIKYWRNFTTETNIGANYKYRSKKQYPTNATVRVIKRDGEDCLDENGWYSDDSYDTLLKCIGTYNGSQKTAPGRVLPERLRVVPIVGQTPYMAQVITAADGWPERTWTWRVQCGKSGTLETKTLEFDYSVADYAAGRSWLTLAEKALALKRRTDSSWSGYRLPARP